ncbi:MAG: carbohydrate-binding domain-containing protein, partial [Alphaproteobacteria bacterium]|nr:carbohydrate-binding domain-containing protein [Alphaproteobacteria bacterium]
MKNRLLLTTALVAVSFAANVYANPFPEDATDLISGSYVVEHTGNPIFYEGNVKISKDAVLKVNTYGEDAGDDWVSPENAFVVKGNLTVGDEQQGGGTLIMYREDNEKPMMFVEGNTTIDNGASVTMRNDDGSWATIISKTADIKGGTLDLNGAEFVTDEDLNISGGVINLTEGSISAGNNEEQSIGNINITGGEVNLIGKTVEAGMDSNGVISISGGKVTMQGNDNDDAALWGNVSVSDKAVINMNGKARIDVDESENISISGGTINVAGNENTFRAVNDVEMSGGVLNIAKGADLHINKDDGTTAEKGTLALSSEVNLNGTLISNVSGDGSLNIKSSGALVDGNVLGTNLSFEADHSLSKAISGAIEDLASLNVNTGTLTFDKEVYGTLGTLTVKDTLNIEESLFVNNDLNLTDNATINMNEDLSVMDGGINMTGGTVNVNEASVLWAAKDINISGGELNLKGEMDTIYDWLDENDVPLPKPETPGDININGGIVNILSDSAEISTEGNVVVSDSGVINVNNGAKLYIGGMPDEDDEEDGDENQTDTINLINGGSINLAGTLVANISGDDRGVINFESSEAVIEGDVDTPSLTFNFDHSLSKAITGTLGSVDKLTVAKGTLSFDKEP